MYIKAESLPQRCEICHQADCFDLHGERTPRELKRELDRRNAAREYDPMGSVAEFQRSERIAGA